MKGPPWLEEDAAGVRVAVHLLPRAAREEVGGTRDQALLVRVTAPPVEGRANDALCKLLSKRLRVAPSRIEVVAGQRSRRKTVRVAGLSAAEVAARLG
jgi:uncharacterized protein (TIGR00251 family)